MLWEYPPFGVSFTQTVPNHDNTHSFSLHDKKWELDGPHQAPPLPLLRPPTYLAIFIPPVALPSRLVRVCYETVCFMPPPDLVRSSQGLNNHAEATTEHPTHNRQSRCRSRNVQGEPNRGKTYSAPPNLRTLIHHDDPHKELESEGHCFAIPIHGGHRTCRPRVTRGG